MKQVLYYSTGKRKEQDVNVVTCFVDIGSDCAIAFQSTIDAGPSDYQINKSNKKKGKTQAKQCAIVRANFWLGRILLMRVW